MIAAYTEGDEPVPGFRLVKLLACETFGSVWRATGPGGMSACVKIVSLVNRQRLKEFSALRLVKHVRHPNLVPILAFWLKDKNGRFIDEHLVEEAEDLPINPVDLIMVMGLGDKSLFDRLKEYQKEGYPGIAPEELLPYMEDVADALDHLNQPIHDLGKGLTAIQHCDIKPQNILIVGSAAQVCDLGGARVVEDPRDTSAVGSAAYMAPEYITEGRPSRHTDQYSLAVCYVELRTGSLPLNAKSPAAAYLTHIRGALDFSQLPPAEREIVARATSVRPDSRYPTCVTLVRALREACGLAQSGAVPPSDSSAPNINLLARRRPMPVPAKDSKAVINLPPCVTSPEREGKKKPSDDSVDLGGYAPDREHDTLKESQSVVSRADAFGFPSGAGLERTAVVDVHVVHDPDTADDDDEIWPSPPAVSTETKASQADTESVPEQTPEPAAVEPVDETGAPFDKTPTSEPERQIPWQPGGPHASRKRRWLPVPLAIFSSALLGLFASWLARNPASSETVQSEAPPAQVAEHQQSPGRGRAPDPPADGATARPPVEIKPDPTPRAEPVLMPVVARPPFAIHGRPEGFESLADAIAAAGSGDTIYVRGDESLIVDPLDIRGKELTIKAAPGSRPSLQLARQPRTGEWLPLLSSDRALTLEGLDLRRGTDGGPAHLIAMTFAPLRMLRCRLDVPYGAGPIVCRNPGQVELTQCTLQADALGISIEVGDGSPCSIRFSDCSFRILNPRGAALSLWAPEVRRESPIQLVMERNTFRAGRVAAFKALPRGLEVHAHGNTFAFREAVCSFVGYGGGAAWREATVWQGHDNHFSGPSDWLHVDGRPAGIHDLESWRTLWGITGNDLSASSSGRPVRY